MMKGKKKKWFGWSR